ncbi:MAG: diacylglycerol kinase [Bacteroidetes bacterium]|nr:MAG: diacylglycerol kinase [Bacteroidota bacterium]
MKLDIVSRILCGCEGIRYAWREERGFRNQVFGLAAMVATLSIIQPKLLWWGLALMASLTAISFEMLNSAIESLADHLHPEHHPKIGKVKDLACGAVIVSSFGLLFIGIAMIMDSLWG